MLLLNLECKLEKKASTKLKKIVTCSFISLERKISLEVDLPRDFLPYLRSSSIYVVNLSTNKPEKSSEERILMKGRLLKQYSDKAVVFSFGGLLAIFRGEKSIFKEIESSASVYLSIEPAKNKIL